MHPKENGTVVKEKNYMLLIDAQTPDKARMEAGTKYVAFEPLSPDFRFRVSISATIRLKNKRYKPPLGPNDYFDMQEISLKIHSTTVSYDFSNFLNQI